jgi:hypothetical protein
MAAYEYRVEDPIPATHPMRKIRCSGCGHGPEWHTDAGCGECQLDRVGEPWRHTYSLTSGRF